MEKYILNLLKENKRIIIPDFGAFIIRQQNPPEIAFNGLLTFNDGKLTEYVSKEVGISYVEAAAKVSDYAEKLKADLHQHNRLTFNEIGWVWTDDFGEMQFTAWKDTGKTPVKASAGLKDLDTILKEAHPSPSDIQPVEPIHQEEGLEPSIISADQTPFTLDETLKDVDVDATKDVLTQKSSDSGMVSGKIPDESFTLEESDKSATTEYIAPEKTIDLQVNISGSQNELHKVETVTEPVIQRTERDDDKDSQFDEKIMASISAIRAKAAGKDSGKSTTVLQELSPNQDWRRSEIKSTYSSKSVKEKKRRSWILPVLIIGLVIIVAGAAWFLFPDQVKNILYPNRQLSEKILTEEEALETTDITSSENEIGEQLSEQEQVPEQNLAPVNDEEAVITQPETPVISENTQGSDRKYYIVAGCFKSRDNAEKLVTRLKEKGFNAELFGTHDNLYAVSFSSFYSKVQATEELNHIRQTTEPDAWLLLY